MWNEQSKFFLKETKKYDNYNNNKIYIVKHNSHLMRIALLWVQESKYFTCTHIYECRAFVIRAAGLQTTHCIPRALSLYLAFKVSFGYMVHFGGFFSIVSYVQRTCYVDSRIDSANENKIISYKEKNQKHSKLNKSTLNTGKTELSGATMI